MRKQASQIVVDGGDVQFPPLSEFEVDTELSPSNGRTTSMDGRRQ